MPRARNPPLSQQQRQQQQLQQEQEQPLVSLALRRAESARVCRHPTGLAGHKRRRGGEEEEEEEESKSDAEMEDAEEAERRAALRRESTGAQQQQRASIVMPDQGINADLRDAIRTPARIMCRSFASLPGEGTWPIIRGSGRIVSDWFFHVSADMYVPNPVSFFQLQGTVYEPTRNTLLVYRMLAETLTNALKPETDKMQVVDPENPKIKSTIQVPVKKNPVVVSFMRVPHKRDPAKFVSYWLRLTEIGDSANKRGLKHQFTQLLLKHDAISEKLRGTPSAADEKRYNKCLFDTHHLDTVVWRNFCMAYDPRLAHAPDYRNSEEGSMSVASGAFSPELLFTREHACTKAKNLGAHPAYCKPHALQADKRSITFPENGANAYHIRPSDFRPEILHELFFPFVKPNRSAYQQEFEAFVEQHRDVIGELDRDQQREVFDRLVNSTTVQQPRNDLDTFGARVRQSYRELRKECQVAHGAPGAVDRSFHAKWLERRMKVHLPELQSILSKTGDIAPALQALAAYKEEYVRVHRTLGLHVPKVWHNLDRFAHARALDAVGMGSIIDVHTQHADALMILYSVLDVYTRGDLHLNQLLSGPAAIGKSFLCKLIPLLFIEGTYMMVANSTLKAFTAPGKDNASLILVYEEASARILGGKTATGMGRGGGTGSSEEGTFLKGLLANTEFTTKTIEFDPKRKNVVHKTETSVVMVMALNCSLGEFEDSVKSRFVITEAAAETKRDIDVELARSMRDGGELQPVLKSAQSVDRDRWSRVQCIVGHIKLYISTHMLTPIDLTVAKIVFLLVAKLAHEQSLDMLTDKRDAKKFEMLVKVFVVLDAADVLWGAPGSPLLTRPHRDEHFFLVDKYLFARVEHATAALGLMSRLWQSNTRDVLIESMIRTWFKDHQRDLDAYTKGLKRVLEPGESEDSSIFEARVTHEPQMPGDLQVADLQFDPRTGKLFGGRKPSPEQKKRLEKPEVQQYLKDRQEWNGINEKAKYWMYTSCSIGAGSPIPEIPNGNRASQLDLIKALAARISRSMSKSFLEDEVVAKLMAMTNSTVEITREQYTEERVADDDEDDADARANSRRFVSIQRPQLVVEYDVVRLAMPIVEQWQKFGADVLFRCTRDACNLIRYFTKSEIQVGALFHGECERDQSMRDVWRIIEPETKPDPADKTRRIPLLPGERPDELFKRLKKDEDSYRRLPNAAYRNGSAIAATRALLGSIDPYWNDPKNIQQLFPSNREFFLLDQNLDRYAAQQRANALGLNAHEQHMHPSNDAMRREEAIFELEAPVFELSRLGIQKLDTYPEIARAQRDGHLLKKAIAESKADPTPFNLSTRVKALQEEQLLFPSYLQQILEETPEQVAAEGPSPAFAPAPVPAAAREPPPLRMPPLERPASAHQPAYRPKVVAARPGLPPPPPRSPSPPPSPSPSQRHPREHRKRHRDLDRMPSPPQSPPPSQEGLELEAEADSEWPSSYPSLTHGGRGGGEDAEDDDESPEDLHRRVRQRT